MGLRQIQSANEWERSMRHERQRPSAKCRPTPPPPQKGLPHAPARAWPRNLRGPPAQQRPKKDQNRPRGGDLARGGRSRPAPRNLRRERGRRRGKHPRGRMSTQADSRKHSLGVTRPEGLSQTGGGPNEHRQQAECSYNPTSQRLGGNGHPLGLARRHMGEPLL
jgi:hypothetical protein